MEIKANFKFMYLPFTFKFVCRNGFCFKGHIHTHYMAFELKDFSTINPIPKTLDYRKVVGLCLFLARVHLLTLIEAK